MRSFELSFSLFSNRIHVWFTNINPSFSSFCIDFGIAFAPSGLEEGAIAPNLRVYKHLLSFREMEERMSEE